MAGYTRQSTFADGDTITAALFNNEYNQLVNAFSNTSGHSHDGTAASGPVIGLIGDAGETSPNNKVLIDTTNNYIEFYVEVSSAPVQQLYIADGAIIPVTDSDIDLGTTSLRFKDTYTDTITTTGNATIGGNLTVTGNATISGNLTFGDADTDSINLAAEIDSHIVPNTDDTYDLGTSTKEWRNLYIDGTANIDSLIADTADINGGTIDGATIATSDITVGSGKTLNVSAGTLTLADNQISGDKVEGGTIAATTITALTYGSLNDGTITITAFVDEDDMSSNSATLVPTQQSVKAYVDSQVTAQDLDFQGDSGGALSIDLDSESLTIAGGTGLDTVGSGNTVTVNIDATVATLTGSQTLTNKTIDVDNNTVSNIEVDNLKSGVLDTDLTSVAATDTTIASAKAIKTYVDAQVTAQDLDFAGDTGGALSIDLDSESLTIAGGTGIDTVGASNTLTVNIDSTVTTLTGTQTLTNKTLTSPDVNTPDIDGGTIDGTVIGGATPAAGTFTTLTANTSITGTLATAAQTNITSVGTLSSLTTSGNVIVGGNLTVNGTTTTLNTATLDVEDKNITLNYGSGDTTGSANGAGITIQDAVDASTDASILWDTTNDEFDFSHPINVTGKITGTGTSVFTNLDISGDVDVDGTLETDALTIGGVTSVPFEAADHSKLDGIEAGATGDQTNAEIRAAVEAATDSNVFTDADHSKLNAIEASADVTDTANVTSAGALMDSELTSIADVKALNQSVVSGATPTFTTTNFTDATNKRFMTDAQETKLDSVESGATADQTAAEIRTLVESASDSNVFTDADHSKLNGIESNATADQTDEEIQDIVGGMVTGNTESGITVTYQDIDGTLDFSVASQTDNNFTTTLKNKLDGIEASATADQTAAEIRTLVESATDSNVFTDADHSKLNGIAANANNYVLPTNLAGDDINIDTGALTGATVISDLDFNITTNTSGLVTDANASVATRTLTLANLGYTGATNATNNTGTVTSVGISTSAGLDGSGTITSSGSVNISLDLSELTDMTAAVVGTQDELILLDSGAERRKLISEITLSDFNNDLGWTSNTGDITAVTVSGGNLTGGGTSGSVGIGFSSTPSFTDVYVDDQIISTGDIDTYMQFNAANTWRVVTAGSERISINGTGNITLADGVPLHPNTGRNTDVSVGTSFVNVLNFATLGNTDPGRGFYQVTVVRAGASVGTSIVLLIGVSTGSNSYIYDTIFANGLSAQMSGSNLQVKQPSGSTVSCHVTAIPIGITGYDS